MIDLRHAAAASRACELRRDLLERERLDDVALFEVLELGDLNAALEALRDFAHVVFKSPQAFDLAVEDDGRIADDARLRIARDLAAGDVRSRRSCRPC